MLFKCSVHNGLKQLKLIGEGEISLKSLLKTSLQQLQCLEGKIRKINKSLSHSITLAEKAYTQKAHVMAKVQCLHQQEHDLNLN